MPTRDTWSDGLSPDEILVRAGRIGWLVHAVVVGLAALGLNALDMPQVAVGLAATGIPLSLVIAAIMFRGFNLAAYFVLTGLAGIMWGTLALAVAPSGLGEATLFVTLVIGGTAAAAIAIQFPRPWLVATSLAPALTGLTIAHLLPATPLGLSIAPMVLIYGLLLALLARYMREIFNANLRLTAQLSEQVDALGRAVEERDRATAVKQRLLRHTGHDMRQALHAVKFVLHFLRDQRLSDETRELVTRGQRSLDVLGGLFQSIQDISQIQSERIEVRHEPVVLGSLLRRATSTLAGEARQREIALHVIPSTARVETDPLLLQRIVQNIAANAVKFAGSRVVIGVRRRAGRFTIEILDDGPGIPRGAPGRDIRGVHPVATRHRRSAGPRPGPCHRARTVRQAGAGGFSRQPPGGGNAFRDRRLARAGHRPAGEGDGRDLRSCVSWRARPGSAPCSKIGR